MILINLIPSHSLRMRNQLYFSEYTLHFKDNEGRKGMNIKYGVKRSKRDMAVNSYNYTYTKKTFHFNPQRRIRENIV